MHSSTAHIVGRIAAASVVLCLLQACSSTATAPTSLTVASAYESSGTVSMKPYTRTIFSSNDF